MSKNRNPLKDLSNEELIDLYIEHSCSAEGVDKFLNICKNSTAREFNQRKIDRTKIQSEEIQKKIENYSKNPKKCEYCGKPLPWDKRNNRFCNSSCAASKNNMGKVKNPKGIGHPKKKEKATISKQTKLAKPRLTRVNKCHICGRENCQCNFCKKHNLQQLNGLVKYLGFDESAIGTERVFGEFARVQRMIYDLYWGSGYSRIGLGQKFGYPGRIMPMNVLKKTLEIPTREQSDAVKNAIKQKRLNLPSIDQETGIVKCTTEWHTTWTGDSVFLRSSYEIEYAEYLDENQISYSVEGLRIEYYDTQQNKTRIAIPDFYLSSTNEIVEIKSDFTLDIQEMRDKFEAYKKLGYKPKLILEKKEVDLENLQNLIDKERYNRILDKNISHFRNK